MKKLITILFINAFFISIGYANVFYNFTNLDINANNINTKIKKIYEKYKLNIDLVIIDSDPKNCSNENKFIFCVRERYGITPDLLFVINETTNKFEGNILNKRESNGLITSTDINSFQNMIVDSLKEGDIEGAFIKYLDEIDSFSKNLCNSLNNNKYNIKTNNCYYENLNEIKNEINKKNELAHLKEKEKINKYIVLIVIFGIIIIFGIFYIKKYLTVNKIINNLKNMHKDGNYYLIKIKNEYFLLEDDKKKYLREFDLIIKDIENILSNYDKSSISEKYEQIKKEMDYTINNYEKDKTTTLKKDSVEKQIDEIKDINI